MIVTKLRQVDALVSQGWSIVDAIRRIGVSEVPLDIMHVGVPRRVVVKSADRRARLRVKRSD